MLFGSRRASSAPNDATLSLRPSDTGTLAHQACPPTSANGLNSAASVPATSLPPEQQRSNAIASKRLAVAFGEVVAILMRSPEYKHYSLADLEWLIVPPITAGQIVLAEAQSKTTGATAPIGVIIWARVSSEVDLKLSANLAAPMRLHPNEWTSGDNLWLIDAVGDPKVLGGVLKRLTETTFKDRVIKTRMRGANGEMTVHNLQSLPDNIA